MALYEFDWPHIKSRCPQRGEGFTLFMCSINLPFIYTETLINIGPKGEILLLRQNCLEQIKKGPKLKIMKFLPIFGWLTCLCYLLQGWIHLCPNQSMWSWVKTKKIFIYLQDDSFLRSILDLFKNWNGKEMMLDKNYWNLAHGLNTQYRAKTVKC